jgi:hypothetical protein
VTSPLVNTVVLFIKIHCLIIPIYIISNGA